MSGHIINEIGSHEVTTEPTRAGFGRGLVKAAQLDPNIIGLSADLTESTQMGKFAEAFPDRYIQVGIAEQNLVTVASGVSAMGKIPFASSYAAFSPGRNYEQIRTTICLNDRPVKIIGSHAGISAGPDGATHQMLEDIALMRALPNMIVIAPCDSIEAEKATLAMAKNNKPNYMRLSREKTEVFTTADAPFKIGEAYVLRPGTDLALIATGTSTYQALVAAKILANDGINAEVLHVPTIKPLDQDTVLATARKCGRVITIEEAQINAGFGSAIAELLGENLPMPIKRLGMQDRFGESGTYQELMNKFGLTGRHIAMHAHQWVDSVPQYHR